MVMFVITAVAVLAIVAVIWSDVAQRDDDDIDQVIEQRASRYEAFAVVAADLRLELGREPSVREIYAVVEADEPEADEPEADQVVDLRTRVDRIVSDRSSLLAE
jgi:hypothetical protein